MVLLSLSPRSSNGKIRLIVTLLLVQHCLALHVRLPQKSDVPYGLKPLYSALYEPDTELNVSPLGLSLDELTDRLQGSGRAKQVWAYYRQGIDPLSTTGTATLGKSALNLLNDPNNATQTIKDTVAKLIQVSTSRDGTTKLLLQLQSSNHCVESVIIPWPDRQKSTLCISSQVGCAQACTFCLTGRMGKLKSLSVEEIIVQLFFAQQIVNERTQQANSDDSINSLYPIDNIVFMGMGEPADNSQAVVKAVNILTNPHQFSLAPRKITISTVAPSPMAFFELGQASAVLAWSVHVSRDDLRRQLVPTTRYTMSSLLHDGLIPALLQRSRRMRAIMLEITLLDSVNDSHEDAVALANDICQPILDQVTGVKLVVNLIPWNDIGATFGAAAMYKQPKPERICAYQQALTERGILCYVRTTRGDDESAACGQLTTKNVKSQVSIDGVV